MTNKKLQVIDGQSDDQIIERIERNIANPPQTSRVFTITPNVAKYVLEKYNIGNRPKKISAITAYAEYMSADQWALTGDTLKFSDLRLLRDGQNRLKACIRSGRSFATHVVFGIPDDHFRLLDQGKNRNGADVLAIAGYKNTTLLSAAARWICLIEGDRAKSRQTFRPDETLRLMQERYPNLQDFAADGSSVYRHRQQPAGLATAMIYLFHRVNADKAALFTEAWIDGNFGGAFRSIGKMQAAIAKIADMSSGRVHEVVRAALIVKAWNFYLRGKTGVMSDYVWNPSEDFPEIMEG